MNTKKYNLKPTLAYLSYRNNKEGYYVASIPVLNITNFGKTPSEALHNLAIMEADVLDVEKEMGNKLPTYNESLIARNAVKRGGKREGSGRKAIDNPREKIVNVAFNSSEFKVISQVSRQESKPVATLIRDWALSKAKRTAKDFMHA